MAVARAHLPLTLLLDSKNAIQRELALASRPSLIAISEERGLSVMYVTEPARGVALYEYVLGR